MIDGKATQFLDKNVEINFIVNTCHLIVGCHWAKVGVIMMVLGEVDFSS